MGRFDFRVLGPLEVRRDGELLPLPAPKHRALLGLLLLHANEPVSPDELVEELWGEEAPATARASLRNQIHALRKLLGAETLERGPHGYVLNVEPGELDLERFERLVAEARRAEPRDRAAKLRAALALWRGAALVEFPGEPFAQHEIARLEEERLIALEERIDVELELGEHARLVPELESLVKRYPLRERIWAQLILAQYRAGRQADALATYRRARRLLVEQLGIEPGATLRDLQRAVLLRDPALADPSHRLESTLERAAAILPGSGGERAESLYEYALALARTGELRRAVQTLGAAARLAAAARDPSVEERARLYASYLSMWTEGWSATAVLAEAERAQARFEGRGDAKGRALALRFQYQCLAGLGRADGAAELALRAAALASQAGDLVEEAAALVNRAESLARGTAPVADAVLECERIVEEVERRALSPPSLFVRGALALGHLYAQGDRLDDARSIGERARGIAREFTLFSFLVGAEAALGALELDADDVPAAARHLRAAYALIESEEDHTLKPEIAAALACVLVRLGAVDEAGVLAREARADSAGDFGAEVLWRRGLALVAAHEGRCKEAIVLSDEARTRANGSDRLTFRGETLEDAALVCRLAGDAGGVDAALVEALALYERKGNVVGARRAERALAARHPLQPT